MRFYADEDAPKQIVYSLRELGHDVLTANEDLRANKGIEDKDVLARATELDRVALTKNRKDYISLDYNNYHSGIVSITEPKNEDYDSVALAIHKEVKDKESLEGEHIRINRANTEKEKAEIEKLREEHKQELEKAKEEYLKNKELEKEQKIKEKEELKQKEEQKIEKEQKEESEKKQLEKEQSEKKQEEKTPPQEEKKEAQRIYSSEELKVDRISDDKFRFTLASDRTFTAPRVDNEHESQFLKLIENSTFRQDFVKQLEESKAEQQVKILKVQQIEEPIKPPTPILEPKM